jgi:lipopolysaccharide/colanic/teichoic acid biosynthesis glycosyltransferase
MGIRARTSHSRWRWFWLPLLAVVLDALAVFLAAMIAYALRFSQPVISVYAPNTIPEPGEYLLFGLVLGLVYVIIARSYRSYSSRWRVPIEQEIGLILTGTVLSMGVVLAAIFFYREFDYSRAVFLGTLILMIPLLILARAVFYRLRKSMFQHGLGIQRVAFWGWGEAAQALWEELSRARAQGFELVGALGEAPIHDAVSLGSLGDLPQITANHRIDLVVFAPPPGEEDRMAEVFKASEGLPVELLYVPGAVHIGSLRSRLAEINGRPLMRLRFVPFAGWRCFVKHSFDCLASLILFLCMIPVTAVVAFVLLITSARPIILRHPRVGMNGREFNLLRFHARDSSGFGRFLLRWRLDKIPELLSVLAGQMSLVGPEPASPDASAELFAQLPLFWDRRRIKSGMTGWAQVNNATEVAQRAEFDIGYIEQWSLGFDIRILLLAVGRLLQGKGR